MGRTAQGRGKRRVSIRYVGHVQGVGFRWTAQQIASSLGLTGWARNEYDGSVTVELQGEPLALAQFQTMLKESFSKRRFSVGYTIDDISDIEVDPRETGFSARY